VSEAKKLNKNEKEKKKLKLQAQLLDVLLQMQEDAERGDEIRNLERIIRDFQGTVSFVNKKMKFFYWNDMVCGFDVLLCNARRRSEMENIAKIVDLAEKIKKL
jgi:hypothetical protein